MLAIKLTATALLTGAVLGSRDAPPSNEVVEVISVDDGRSHDATTIIVPIEFSKDSRGHERPQHDGLRHHGFLHHDYPHHHWGEHRPPHRPETHSPYHPETHSPHQPETHSPHRPETHSPHRPETQSDHAGRTSLEPTSRTAPGPTHSANRPSQQPTPVDTGYEATALFHHNLHRRNHSAPDVIWSANLRGTAKKIADGCVYAHDMYARTRDGGGYGQNIACGVVGSNISAVITDMFYNDEVSQFRGLYGKANPHGDLDRWGHFTQLVWRNTQAIGCYTADCSSSGLANTGGNVLPFFTVCNYQPPGNAVGRYAKNVLPPLGYPTAEWDTRPS